MRGSSCARQRARSSIFIVSESLFPFRSPRKCTDSKALFPGSTLVQSTCKVGRSRRQEGVSRYRANGQISALRAVVNSDYFQISISHPRTHTHTLSAPCLTHSMAKDISEFITLRKKDSVQTVRRLRAQHLCLLKMENIGGALSQVVTRTELMQGRLQHLSAAYRNPFKVQHIRSCECVGLECVGLEHSQLQSEARVMNSDMSLAMLRLRRGADSTKSCVSRLLVAGLAARHFSARSVSVSP